MKNGCWQQRKYGEKSTMSSQGKALQISRQGNDIKDACSIQNPKLMAADVICGRKIIKI
jgi:hypothetical protein